MQLVVFQIFMFLVFLFPVAGYLLVLAGVNKRDAPALCSGAWDMVGLLIGLSGFLLAAGPAILYTLQNRALRASLTLQDDSPLIELFTDQWTIMAVYFGCVVFGAVGLIWLRRRTSVIYNIEPRYMDYIFTQVCDRMGLTWSRKGRQIYFAPQLETAPADGSAAMKPNESSENESQGAQAIVVSEMFTPHDEPGHLASTSPLAANQQNDFPAHTIRGVAPVLQMDTFPALFNVTLRWRKTAEDLRAEMEPELQSVLETVRTRDNACAGWLLAISGAMFGLILVTVVFLIAASFVLHSS